MCRCLKRYAWRKYSPFFHWQQAHAPTSTALTPHCVQDEEAPPAPYLWMSCGALLDRWDNVCRGSAA